MKKEYDEYLCQQFPKLYVNRNKSAYESCMAAGFCVGDGWYPIILGLSMSIQGHIDSRNSERAKAIEWNKMVAAGEKPSWWGDGDKPEKKKVPKAVKQTVVGQVKEKFGTLRFYADNTDKEIDAMIALAETMSSVTCEDCGGYGTVSGKNWLRTQCLYCRDTSQRGEGYDNDQN